MEMGSTKFDILYEGLSTFFMHGLGFLKGAGAKDSNIYFFVFTFYFVFIFFIGNVFLQLQK